MALAKGARPAIMTSFKNDSVPTGPLKEGQWLLIISFTIACTRPGKICSLDSWWAQGRRQVNFIESISSKVYFIESISSKVNFVGPGTWIDLGEGRKASESHSAPKSPIEFLQPEVDGSTFRPHPSDAQTHFPTPASTPSSLMARVGKISEST